MRKVIGLISILFVVVFLFSSCDQTVGIPDGIYRVEMSEYDENGYKDFVEFEIKGSKVISIVADAHSEVDGSLKTDSEDMKGAMEAITGTYPEKFYRDLINEYLGGGGLELDVIAGATASSENFFKLMEVAKNAVKTGDTSVRIVETN